MMRRFLSVLSGGALCGALCGVFAILLMCAQAQPPDALVLCAGSNELSVRDAATGAKLWRWSGADARGLEPDERRRFDHLDECKPLDGGKRILISASNSGCALLEYPSGRIVWKASATNAHSLEMLPRDRIIVASSLSGDRLVLFDLKGGAQPVWKTPLHSAHGVVWDAPRGALWALGFDELRRYTLADWDTDHPSLVLKATHPLPAEDGHDLRAVPSSSDLIVTTETGVFLFDRERGEFRRHPALGEKAKLKSVDIHPTTKRTVYGAWSAKVEFLDPAGALTLKDAHPYKTRWFPGLRP